MLAAQFLPIDAVFLGEKPKHDGPVYSRRIRLCLGLPGKIKETDRERALRPLLTGPPVLRACVSVWPCLPVCLLLGVFVYICKHV